MSIMNSEIIELGSEWDDDSNMRIRVRKIASRPAKILVDIIEITSGTTSKARALKLARKYAVKYCIMSMDASMISDIAYDRKGTRLDGTKVLTHIRVTTWAFQGVD